MFDWFCIFNCTKQTKIWKTSLIPSVPSSKRRTPERISISNIFLLTKVFLEQQVHTIELRHLLAFCVSPWSYFLNNVPDKYTSLWYWFRNIMNPLWYCNMGLICVSPFKFVILPFAPCISSLQEKAMTAGFIIHFNTVK